MVSQPSFHPMSSLISTILNSIFLGLHSIYHHLPWNSTFQVPIFSNLHFIPFPYWNFHILCLLSLLVHPLSSLDSTVQSYPSPLPIYHPMFYFPLFHFISSIVFPTFNISQFSIFPNPYIIHYLSNSQLLTPNMSTKRPIIVLRWKITQQYTIPIHFHKLLVNGKVGNWF